MADPQAPSPSPGPETTDITPGEGDALVAEMRGARAGVRGPAPSEKIAADDSAADADEELVTPRPPPLG